MHRAAALLVGILLPLSVANEAAAQCTTCSPLSLPSGSLVGQDLESARSSKSSFSTIASATTGWVGFPEQVSDNQPIRTRESARFDLFLTTVQATAIHRSGLGLDAVVPFGVLSSRVGQDSRRDVSLGDVELKPRFTTLVGSSLRLTGIAGAVLPTGSYTERSGPGALGDAARSITIGRGVYWGLAEIEARVEPVKRVGLTASAQGRMPFGEASDGFRWGPELRTTGEVEVRPIPMIGLAAGGELSVRGSGSSIDPFLNERVDSTNVQAKIVSVTPSVRANFENGIFASLTGRIPVYQDLEGLQFKQGPGVFAGLGYVFRPDVAAAATPSVGFVVREYGADWCTACKKLEPILAASRAQRSNVRFEKVDVTSWSEGELARRVPGATALPIVEVLRDGKLVTRLEGERAFGFENHLKETM